MIELFYRGLRKKRRHYLGLLLLTNNVVNDRIYGAVKTWKDHMENGGFTPLGYREPLVDMK